MVTPSATKDLQHYKELAFAGVLEQRSIRELASVAVAVTFGEVQADQISVPTPINNVDFYEVIHRDTGRRRSIGRRYEPAPVYRSHMRPLNLTPMNVHVEVNTIDSEHIGSTGATLTFEGTLRLGVLESSLLDENEDGVPTGPSSVELNKPHRVRIHARNLVTSSMDIGKPTFCEPPNEEHHNLVRVFAYDDHRLLKY
jgi:hypothetical protein